MKEYIAQPNYEYELTELTEPGKLCGPPGVLVKKYDCARAIVKAREEGRREAIKKLLVLGADGLGVYYDTGDRIVVGRRTYLIDADVFDALLTEGKKEQINE